jgi:hypothetical protein
MQETLELSAQDASENTEKESPSSVNNGVESSLSIYKMEVRALSNVSGGGVILGD